MSPRPGHQPVVKAYLDSSGAMDVVRFSHLVRRNLASSVKSIAEGLKDDETVAALGATIFAHCDNSKNGALTTCLLPSLRSARAAARVR